MQTFQNSYTDEPRQVILVDPLLLIPRFTCQAGVRLDTHSPSFFRWPHFYSFLLLHAQRNQERALFNWVDPVFLIPRASGHRLRQLATGHVRIHTA